MTATIIGRSPALNPTSSPFFPGSFPRADDRELSSAGLGIGIPPSADQQSSSPNTSSAGLSVKSSPSPPPDLESDRLSNHSESKASSLGSQLDPIGSLATFDLRKEVDLVFLNGSSPELKGVQTPNAGAVQWNSNFSLTGGGVSSGRTSVLTQDPPRLSLGAFGVNAPEPPLPPFSKASSRVASSASPFMAFKPSSPASSTGSISGYTSSFDQAYSNFEAQLKVSPIIIDLMARLARTEETNKEIQRELADVNRKLSALVVHTLGSTTTSVEPEFKNPFAPTEVGRSLTPSAAMTSLAPIAPHQAPVVKSDDLAQVSQRLNSLTASVGQLLALQTQQRLNDLTSAISPPTQQHQQQQIQHQIPPRQPSVDIAPNQLVGTGPVPNPQVTQAALLGHGFPNRVPRDPRSAVRTPNPPIRAWSSGTLELPNTALRPTDSVLGRDTLPRDKRRSVATLRRDSLAPSDGSGDQWNGRDNGPVVSKWEQLPLAPDLLRALSKFGVGPPNKIQQRALPFLLRGSDIIAQAPPTQERIAAYVIPAIHVALGQINVISPTRGPTVLMISTTVDQATQAQRMIRDIGSTLGIKSALGVGAVGNDVSQELRVLHQNMPHILCGTPQKLHALFTSPGGIPGSDVRFLVLDEVDQLIARNLHEFVYTIVKLLPAPRSRAPGALNSAPGVNGSAPVGTPPIGAASQFGSAFENGFSAALGAPFPNTGRRFSAFGPLTGSPPNENGLGGSQMIERQTALFSNTVPQDVLNLSNTIQLREPIRVLVRRDGNVTQADTSQGSSRGLRQFYLYLAFTASSRADPSLAASGGGLGIIGSGRSSVSAETAQAREWKLDALADLFEDLDVGQAIVHVGGLTALDAVVYKLVHHGLEAVPLHNDMSAGVKLAALNKFRGPPVNVTVVPKQTKTKVLVVYDVQVKAPEVFQVPLVINYDLPKAVEEYAHRVAPAISTNHSRAGVVVNFVTATGGDVEMLRSIECFYKIKCPEVPMSLRDIV